MMVDSMASTAASAWATVQPVASRTDFDRADLDMVNETFLGRDFEQ
jgi:hypothetical protein